MPRRTSTCDHASSTSASTKAAKRAPIAQRHARARRRQARDRAAIAGGLLRGARRTVPGQTLDPGAEPDQRLDSPIRPERPDHADRQHAAPDAGASHVRRRDVCRGRRPARRDAHAEAAGPAVSGADLGRPEATARRRDQQAGQSQPQARNAPDPPPLAVRRSLAWRSTPAATATALPGSHARARPSRRPTEPLPGPRCRPRRACVHGGYPADPVRYPDGHAPRAGIAAVAHDRERRGGGPVVTGAFDLGHDVALWVNRHRDGLERCRRQLTRDARQRVAHDVVVDRRRHQHDDPPAPVGRGFGHRGDCRGICERDRHQQDRSRHQERSRIRESAPRCVRYAARPPVTAIGPASNASSISASSGPMTGVAGRTLIGRATGRVRCERPAPPTSHTVAAPSTPCTHRTPMRIQNPCFVHLSSKLMFCKFTPAAQFFLRFPPADRFSK